jgi:hypothetical protein
VSGPILRKIHAVSRLASLIALDCPLREFSLTLTLAPPHTRRPSRRPPPPPPLAPHPSPLPGTRTHPPRTAQSLAGARGVDRIPRDSLDADQGRAREGHR